MTEEHIHFSPALLGIPFLPHALFLGISECFPKAVRKARCKYAVIMRGARHRWGRRGARLSGCVNAEHAQYYHYKLSLPVS